MIVAMSLYKANQCDLAWKICFLTGCRPGSIGATYSEYVQDGLYMKIEVRCSRYHKSSPLTSIPGHRKDPAHWPHAVANRATHQSA